MTEGGSAVRGVGVGGEEGEVREGGIELDRR